MTFIGTAASGAPSTEFTLFDDFINLRGDYAKMKAFSNLMPTLKRLLHFALTCLVFTLTPAPFQLELIFEQEYSNAPFYSKILTLTFVSQFRSL